MKCRRIISMLIVSACLFCSVTSVHATTISDLKRQKEEAQDQLDEINDSIDSMKGEKAAIQNEMDEVNQQLIQTIASVEMLEEEIAEKEKQIQKAQEEYDIAKAEEEAQYEAMKIRIRYMYEKGDVNYVELFMKASSFSDMLNKAEYIERLYEYDRKLLIQFQETKEKVALLKEELEIEQAELEATKGELEEEKEAMEAQMAELEAAASDYEHQIAQARQEAEIFKTKIKKQTAEIARLEEEERRKAQEAARRAAEEAKKKSGTSSSTQKTPAGKATYNTAEIYAANGSESGKKIAAYACTFIGNPYVAGGTSLTNGTDCSGFTQSVYRNFGYSIPRNSYSQRSAGKEVSISEAEPGDIVCYAGHVALYIGNGKIVHASTAKTGIKIGYVSYKPIITVRRIV